MDDHRCRFCRRYPDDDYLTVSFPDGIATVCTDCWEKRDEPDPDVVEWRDTEVEVV